ncbi:MAG TPA: hypothetical protein VIX82_15800 [Solirubrobacteraceae bacterium]
MGQSPTTLDPHWATNLGEAGFSQSFHVQLTRYGTTGGPNGTLQCDPSHINIMRLSEVDDQSALVAKKYQMFILDDGPPIYDPGYQLSYDQVCHQQFNFTDMCVPGRTSSLAQARVETNAVRRQAMYDQLAQTWVNYQPRVDLYSDSSVAVLGQNVGQYLYADEPNL